MSKKGMPLYSIAALVRGTIRAGNDRPGWDINEKIIPPLKGR
jgi:hypothetical protein